MKTVKSLLILSLFLFAVFAVYSFKASQNSSGKIATVSIYQRVSMKEAFIDIIYAYPDGTSKKESSKGNIDSTYEVQNILILEALNGMTVKGYRLKHTMGKGDWGTGLVSTYIFEKE